MDIDRYLARLNLTERPRPNWQGLARLQEAHLLNVPFENLAIHYGQPIDLTTRAIFDKIVSKKRGGFCYELNTLFNDLLTKIGFQTQLLSGRVYSQDKDEYGPEFDHLTILVHLADRSYLTDVGFGEFSFDPVPFETGKPFELSRGNFQIDLHDNTYYRLSKISKGKPYPQYLFQAKPRNLEEFRAMCHYHQTSPDSYFTQQKFISIPTQNGRVTLSGNRLKTKDLEGSVSEETLKDSFEKVARDQFGIDLSC